MRLVLILMMILIFSSSVLAEVRINEIMYDPAVSQGNDTDLEWIELYNDEGNVVNLSNWKIDGNNFDDVLIGGKSYVVVARSLSGFQNYYGSGILAVDGSFSLTNNGDTIDLSNGTKSWLFSYDGSGTGGNGKTWEWTGSNWEESLVDGGTPGQKNSKLGFSQDYGSIEINEIIPDPFSNDNAAKPLGEWVELYNPTNVSMDLKGLVLYDQDDDHELYITDVTTSSGTVILPSGYLVVYRNGDSDFALNNNGFEEVRFYDDYPVNSSNLLDSMSYTGSTEGMSWSKVGGSWYKSTSTLGVKNAKVNGCDWQVEVLPRESIFSSGEKVDFDIQVKRNYGEESILTVNGSIEDIFGKVVKTYKPWTNEKILTTRTKVYTPNLKDDTYKIIFSITSLDCQDNDLNNNVNSKLIVVNPRYKVFDNSLKIEKIYLGKDDEAEWGDRVRVKVNVYKGDETKHSVELYAEKDGKIVSKRTKTNVYDKFQNYTLTLPVQLEPNCDGYRLNGDYEMVLEGLDKEEREGFRIEGFDKELCKGLEESSSLKKGKFGYGILEKPKEIISGEDFKIKIELNGDKVKHNLKVWGYVYRGSKHYGESEVKNVELGVNEIEVADLEIKMDEIKGGEYKLKVKINKDDQKTDKEITEPIKVVEGEKECVVVGNILGKGDESSVGEKLKLLRELNDDGKIVYLASSKESLKWLPVMIMGVLLMLSLILIVKKV